MSDAILRHRFHRILAIAAVALFSTGAVAKDPPQQGVDLVQRASKLQNLKAPGSQPFRLRISFRSVAPGTGEFAGTYSLIWAAPHKWSEEIRFADFDEATVGGDGRRWTAQNRPIEPEAVPTLKALVGVLGFKPNPREQPKKVHNRHWQGATLTCVEWAAPSEWNTKGEKCFSDTGVLVSETAQSGPRGGRRDYSDYASFGEKMYPRTLRTDGEGQRLEANVEELAAITAVNDAWFMPPENAEEWPGCEDPLPPKVVSSPDPEAPRTCIASGARSEVALQVVVDPDGRPSQVLVASSGGFDYDKAAVQAVQGWRFRPVMCGQTPIKAQIRIQVNFHCGG